MSFKRVSALLLTAAMVTSMAACGGKGNNSGQSDSGTKGETKGTESVKDTDASDGEIGTLIDGKKVNLIGTEDPIELTLWDIATEDPTKSTQEGAVQRFMADYPNVTVTQIHTQNDAYKEKLAIAMSSGQCPDMYIHWLGGPMYEYIDSGFAQPIDDIFDEVNKVKFIESAMAQTKYNDKMYAIPFGGLSGSGIYYNKNILAAHGYDEFPETISELEELCDALVADGITPFSLANGSKWTGSMYFMYLAARAGGVDAANEALKGEGGFMAEPYIYAATTIQDWVKKGYFPEGVNSLSTDDGQDRQLMYTGEAAMMLHGTWQSSSMKTDSPEWYEENIDFAPFPKLEGSDADQTVVVGTAAGNGFSFNCEGDKLRAGVVLATNYFNDDQYNADQIEANKIPSIEGMDANITDEIQLKVWDMFFSASDVQLWYDQNLPPVVGEKHKDLMQDLFGLHMTPEQICQAHEDAIEEYNASK